MIIGDEKLSHEKKTEIEGPEEKAKIEHHEPKLLELHTKNKDLQEKFVRLSAEYDNYRRRSIKENETVRENAAAGVYLKMLSVVDEFEIILEHMEKMEGTNKEVYSGLKSLHSKMIENMKKDGVEQMKAMGEKFDPYKHDAIRAMEGEDGKIVAVLQKGYLFKGEVLRHAKVMVGDGTTDGGKNGN
ncbi:MAG: nucleotide exchange factor GrpE [Candidatus Bilamarchaeum sp.]|jgi:molecular chaperone GrpE